MTLFNPTSSLKVYQVPFTGGRSRSEVWLMVETRQGGDSGWENDRKAYIRDLGAAVRLDGWVGGWWGDCLNAQRCPCVSTLPILWEIKAQETVRLPGMIPIWSPVQRSDILKCEAAKAPATSKGLIWSSDEIDRDGKWVSFVKFLDLIAPFLLILPLSFSPDSSSLCHNFRKCLGISVMRTTP